MVGQGAGSQRGKERRGQGQRESLTWTCKVKDAGYSLFENCLVEPQFKERKNLLGKVLALKAGVIANPVLPFCKDPIQHLQICMKST